MTNVGRWIWHIVSSNILALTKKTFIIYLNDNIEQGGLFPHMSSMFLLTADRYTDYLVEAKTQWNLEIGGDIVPDILGLVAFEILNVLEIWILDVSGIWILNVLEIWVLDVLKIWILNVLEI